MKGKLHAICCTPHAVYSLRSMPIITLLRQGFVPSCTGAEAMAKAPKALAHAVGGQCIIRLPLLRYSVLRFFTGLSIDAFMICIQIKATVIKPSERIDNRKGCDVSGMR